jgi:hypothetical protein
MTKIYVGTFPVGANELIGVDDIALKMIAEANRAVDLAREAEEQRQAQSADEAAAAGAARPLKKALKLCLRVR